MNQEIDISSRQAEGSDDLPILLEKNHADARQNKPGFLWRLFSVLRFVPLVMLTAAFFGVIALYFQPPGLQKLMQLLDLQPGAGTSSPIAVPADRESAVSNAAQNEPDLAEQAQSVVGLGILLPMGDVTRVALPFGSADARIAAIEVSEGDTVLKGDLLARLDNENNLLAQIENAKAAAAAREAQLEQTRNSIRSSIAETQAALRSARSTLENARSELERAKSLFDRGFTTNAVIENRTTSTNQAASEVDRLEATLSRFNSETLDDQPDIKVAARNLESAVAELSRARNDLSKARVHSPVDGTVLNIHARAGERPDSEGLMDIGNIDEMTAKLEIYQTEIGKVDIGAEVTLTAEALDVPLSGTVSRIGLEIGRQKLVDSSPAANTDARVVEVTVLLDEVSSRAARRFTNLQVFARIALPGKDK